MRPIFVVALLQIQIISKLQFLGRSGATFYFGSLGRLLQKLTMSTEDPSLFPDEPTNGQSNSGIKDLGGRVSDFSNATQ